MFEKMVELYILQQQGYSDFHKLTNLRIEILLLLKKYELLLN